MSNSINFEIPGNTKGVFVCISNADYHQKVKIDYTTDSGERGSLAFYGRGEDITMSTAAGDTTIPIPLPGVHPDAGVHLVISFYHNPHTPANHDDYMPSNRVHSDTHAGSGVHAIAQFMSEDSTDNDFNDSFLAAIYMTS